VQLFILAAGRLLNLGCVTGHPSLVLPCYSLENWKEANRSPHSSPLLGKWTFFCVGHRQQGYRWYTKEWRNNGIVDNIGHFDNVIDMDGLEKREGIEIEYIKSPTDR